MKTLKIFKMLGVSALILAISSCSLDPIVHTEKITNYPVFDVGEEVVFTTLGSGYTDPGAEVTENGAPISYTSTVTGRYRGGKTLDTNVSDEYTITYTATNKDGYSGSATKTVYVVDNGDLVNSLSGIYTSTSVRDGVVAAQYTDMKYIMIWKNSNGTYEVTDGIGLYYAVGRAYGDNYLARPTRVTAVSIPGNSYTFNSFTIPGFASSGSGKITSLSAIPADKTIKFSSTWAGYKFDVVLKKVEF